MGYFEGFFLLIVESEHVYKSAYSCGWTTACMWLLGWKYYFVSKQEQQKKKLKVVVSN